MNSKFIAKQLLLAVGCGALLVGVYYEVTLAVILCWIMLGTLVLILSLSHLWTSEPDILKSNKGIAKTVMGRSALYKAYSWLWRGGWIAILFISTHYNLLVLYVLMVILFEALVVRYAEQPTA